MSDILVIPSGEGPVGTGFVALRRVVIESGTGTEVHEEGFAVKASDVDGAVTRSLYDLDVDAAVPVSTVSLNPADVFVDLVNDDLWDDTMDQVGYNFKHAVSGTAITKPHTYRVLFECKTTTGTPLKWAHDYKAVSLIAVPGARATRSGVKAIINTDVDVLPFIAAAGIMLESLAPCMAGKLEARQLTQIETWLAAHLVALRDQQYQSKSTGGASATFQGQTGMGLESTYWGQTAVRMDTTGCLAKMGRTTHRVGGAWLGKRPSEQTKYADRD